MPRAVYAGETTESAVNREGSREQAEARKLAKVLSERHPYYEEHAPTWQKLIDFFEGRHLARYLHRHQRESKESIEARAKRLVFRPYTRTIVELYVSYIFSRKIERAPVSRDKYKQWREARLLEKGDRTRKVAALAERLDVEWEEEFLPNCDRRNTKIDRFMAEIANLTLLLGYMGIAVDVPEAEGIPSEAHRRAMEIRPYCRRYTPLEMVNWEIDDSGKFTWVRLKEQVPDAAGPFETRDEAIRKRFKDEIGVDPGSDRRPGTKTPVTGGGKAGAANAVRYRTWTRDTWHVHDVYGDYAIEVASGTHTLKEVPVVVVHSKRELRHAFGGQGVVHDVVGLNQQILNLDNLEDEGIYQQTLSILVIGRQSIEGEEIVISEQNVLEVSLGSFPPYFLSPSPAPLQFMEQRIQVLVGEIYRVSKFGPAFSAAEAKVQSPGTMSHEFNMTNRALADCADNFEQAEWEIHRLYYAWFGKEFRGWTNYPDDFSVSSLQEDLQVLTLARPIRSPLFQRLHEKKLARKVLAHEDERNLQEIDRQIDLIPTMISTGFGPPTWIDEITQEVSMPGTGNPIGPVGKIILAVMEKTGMRPEDFPSEPPPGMGGPEDPNVPPADATPPEAPQDPAAAASAPDSPAATNPPASTEPDTSRFRRRSERKRRRRGRGRDGSRDPQGQ